MRKSRPTYSEYRIGMLERENVRLRRELTVAREALEECKAALEAAESDCQLLFAKADCLLRLWPVTLALAKNISPAYLLSAVDPGMMETAGACGESRRSLSEDPDLTENGGTRK